MLGWVSDKGCELFVYELKASARQWEDSARFKALADSFDLSGNLVTL
jgi:hypothetical protein